MSNNRLAPMPPPKPRNLSRGQFYQTGFLTPQDSDTDSGISADCDQGSPRGKVGSVSSLRRTQDQTPYQNIRSQSSADYLTPNSARKIAAYSTPRRLPLQPQPVPQLTKTKYRVRFADEVDSGASTSSGTSSTHISPRNDLQEVLMNSASVASANCRSLKGGTVTNTSPIVYQQGVPESKPIPNNNDFLSNNRNGLSSRCGTLQRTPTRRAQLSSTPQPQPTYQSVIDPPPYSAVMQRLRSVEHPAESFRDAYIRKNVADTLQRRFRQRSSSLPRGNKTYFDGIDSINYQQALPIQSQSLASATNQLPGSLDNLHISMGAMKRRKLPTAPLMGSAFNLHSDGSDELTAYRSLQFQMMQEDLQRQAAPAPFDQQGTLTRRSTMAKYNIPHITTTTPTQFEANDFDFGPHGVRAQLIALDQRGFRRVLVEKMMPGPFGFYIATGMVSGQRGIFISRVSLPSLSPMLTVGDEIIYVDEELVKGRSLEYVQSVIAGKTTVTITLLPAVGLPALC